MLTADALTLASSFPSNLTFRKMGCLLRGQNAYLSVITAKVTLLLRWDVKVPINMPMLTLCSPQGSLGMWIRDVSLGDWS